MDRILGKALAVQSAMFFGMAACFAADKPPRVAPIQMSQPLASPTPAAYYSRARQLLVGAANGEVRRIAGTQTRSPRDAGRITIGDSTLL